MKKKFSDTSPETEEVLIEGYRRMTPAQKMTCVRDMTRAVQQLALARIRRQYSNESAYKQRLRLAALWLEPEIMCRVFNWDPREKGY